MLIDCRSSEDYGKSHLKSGHLVLHIPAEKLQNGMTANKVDTLLQTDAYRVLWAGRSQRDEIILMDWTSTGTDGSPLWILKNIMLNVSGTL